MWKGKPGRTLASTDGWPPGTPRLCILLAPGVCTAAVPLALMLILILTLRAVPGRTPLADGLGQAGLGAYDSSRISPAQEA